MATISSGTLIVRASGDSWQGDAQFVMIVDGQQLDGVYTVSASRAAGQWTDITIPGDFSSAQTISVYFINDAWGGSASADRNLYVDRITLGGVAYEAEYATLSGNGSILPDSALLASWGSVDFTVGQELKLWVSGDNWQAGAQFIVLVDGVRVGGTITTSASHALGEWQEITLHGNFSPSPASVEVRFVNDAWGGSSNSDRNLYVDKIAINGAVYQAEKASLPDGTGISGDAAAVYSNIGITFATTNTLVVRVSGDNWQGDAQFVVTVDGKRVGGVYAAHASHKDGSWDDVVISGAFGSDPQNIKVSFINDAWGGSSDTDRNLWVDRLVYDGKIYEAESATLPGSAGISNGAVALATYSDLSFDLKSTLTVRVAGESATSNLPQFVVRVDGVQVGDVQTVTATRSSGTWQDVTLSGTFGSNPGTVSVDFLVDSWDGTGRKLYVDRLTLNGKTFQGETAVNYAGTMTADSASLFRRESLTFDVDGSTSGKAVFDGSHAVSFRTNGAVSVGPKLQLERTDPWSAVAAVKIDAYPTTGTVGQLIFGNADDTPYSGYELYVNSQGHLQARVISDFLTGNYLGVEGTTNLVDGQWHTVGATYDGSSKASGVQLFVDGVQQQSVVETDALTGSIKTSEPKTMYVGNQVGGGGEASYFLHGKMDDFALSNVVRSASYFQNAASFSSLIDSHTVLAYDFEAGTGSAVLDKSGSGNNGTLNGYVSWV